MELIKLTWTIESLQKNMDNLTRPKLVPFQPFFLSFFLFLLHEGCNFNTQSTFSFLFRYRLQISPSKYRKLIPYQDFFIFSGTNLHFFFFFTLLFNFLSVSIIFINTELIGKRIFPLLRDLCHSPLLPCFFKPYI